MLPITRKPVPKSQQNSTENPGALRDSTVQQLQEEPSERSVINELAGNHPHESQRQTQAVELISDDDGSASVVLPPEYEDPPQEVSFDRDGLHVNATPAVDGRVDIKISSTTRRLSSLFAPAIQNQLNQNDSLPQFTPLSSDAVGSPTPALSIVIQVVGSRGDVQPFLSLGLELKTFGHRVRIATHPVFQKFVNEQGLEFFSIGGDPAELMAFMVKNPGLIPSFAKGSLADVQKRRRTIREILRGCWRSCYEAGNGLSDSQAPGILDNTGVQKDPKPFVADAIIANPPAFAHLHCAEKLGIPLHLMFTMPWSSTQAFAHPLANIQSSKEDEKMTNYLSYYLVEMMVWQGLGDVINRFRRKVLGLEPVDSTWAPGMVARLGIPYTYCWSPNFLPKPRDWGPNIDIAGFYVLPLASSYVPSPELTSFLQAGPPPVYIGFGSIVVENPNALTDKIFEAIRIAGVRAIVSQGWGGLGESTSSIPSNIFMLGNCPHDWLFERVSCVVHHGGAGTTAAGIAASKPTVIVPFFGDQPFWGHAMARAGAGPPPIHFKALTASNLAAAIQAALQPAMLQKARNLGSKISRERGSENGMKSFHDHLPLQVMGCSVAPHRVAAWKVRKMKMKLSAVAATVLRKEGLLDFRQLKLARPCEYDLNHGPYDPLSGGTIAIVDLFYDVFKGMGEIGSEFVRIPNVGQNNRESSKTHQPVHYPPRSEVSLNKDDKIVSARAAKGIGRITKATIRSPMTFTVGIAQGAHNAPKLWGDKTVRPQEKITGFGSGLKAACKEFVFQTYDGITGLVTQPITGGQEEGAVGVAKGLGKGVLGLSIKPFAAMGGILGYSLKGIEVEIGKGATQKVFNPIISARITQGEFEYIEMSEEEKRDIIERWHAQTAAKEKGKQRRMSV